MDIPPPITTAITTSLPAPWLAPFPSATFPFNNRSICFPSASPPPLLLSATRKTSKPVKRSNSFSRSIPIVHSSSLARANDFQYLPTFALFGCGFIFPFQVFPSQTDGGGLDNLPYVVFGHQLYLQNFHSSRQAVRGQGADPRTQFCTLARE